MINYMGSFESETRFARYFGTRQFLKVYIGSDIRTLMQHSDKHLEMEANTPDSPNNRAVATFGVQYLLPFFIQTDLRIDHTGHLRFQIARNDLALNNRLRLDAVWNSDFEYEIALRYIVIKRLSLSANYDSHFGAGGGITFTY